MKLPLLEALRATAATRVRAGATLLGLCTLGAACALVVSACGSSPSAAAGTTPSTTSSTSTSLTSTTSTSPTALAGASSFAAYQKCLAAHGVTGGFAGFGGFHGRPTGASGTSGPVSGASGFTRPKPTAAETKALAACASDRPKGGAGFAGRGGFSSNPAFATYTACLKAHGVTLGPGVSRTSSAYKAAQTACASDRPAGFGGAGGFGGGAPGGGGASASAYAKTQACLRAHGVNPADPAASTTAQITAAYAACKSVAASTTTTATTAT